jgi:hypothetical protein
VAALADLLDPATRRRLLEHLDDLKDVDREMRRPGSLG